MSHLTLANAIVFSPTRLCMKVTFASCGITSRESRWQETLEELEADVRKPMCGVSRTEANTEVLRDPP